MPALGQKKMLSLRTILFSSVFKLQNEGLGQIIERLSK